MDAWGNAGKWLVAVGVSICFLGGLLILGSMVVRERKIPWLGHLPGDIRIVRQGFSCYIPLATSIVVSLVLTILLNVILRILRRP